MKTEARFVRPCPEPAIEAKADTDTGEISGYASVFDNVDSQGDIIRKGAFARSIQERVRAGKVLLMARHFAHGGDVGEAIGVITEAKEDAKGLWIRAKLYNSAMAQEIRGKIQASPNAYGMSVGYSVVPGGAKALTNDQGEQTGSELTELKLYEVTVTAMPANEETSVEAKTASAVADALTAEEVREVRAFLAATATEKAAAQEIASGKTEPLAPIPPAARTFDDARMRRKSILRRIGKVEE